MEVIVDAAGRIMLPKMMREKFGITPGSKVDISEYGNGMHIAPHGRSARILTDRYGRKVIESDSSITQDLLYKMIDEDRARGMQWMTD